MFSLVLLLSLLVVPCSCGSAERFIQKYEHWSKVCDRPEINLIPGSAYRGTHRWSLTGDTIHNIFNGSRPLEFCADERDLASSMSNEVKNYTCNIEWLGENEICATLSKFSRVYLLGDSLTRHTAQTLFMLLSEDYQYGGFPRTKVDQQSPLRNCGCDGQYSESQDCRGYNHSFSFRDISEVGFCSSYQSIRNRSISLNTVLYLDKETSKFPDNFCLNDSRPHLVYIQGGSHFDTSTDYFMANYFEVWMNNIRAANASCPWHPRYIFVVSGVPANSERITAAYPDQSDGNTAFYNLNMVKRLKRWYPQVLYLNFWNLTHEAVLAHRTSDGYHQLTDTNIIKTMALLNVMKLVR